MPNTFPLKLSTCYCLPCQCATHRFYPLVKKVVIKPLFSLRGLGAKNLPFQQCVLSVSISLITFSEKEVKSQSWATLCPPVRFSDRGCLSLTCVFFGCLELNLYMPWSYFALVTREYASHIQAESQHCFFRRTAVLFVFGTRLASGHLWGNHTYEVEFYTQSTKRRRKTLH